MIDLTERGRKLSTKIWKALESPSGPWPWVGLPTATFQKGLKDEI